MTKSIHPWRNRLALALLAALTLVASGCSTEKVAEHSLEREMTRLVGPAEGYDVDISGLNVAGGRAQGLTATGRRVQPTNAPVLDRLEIRLSDVAYDAGARRVSRVRSADILGFVRTDDLARFLETNRRIEQVSVRFSEPDLITVEARPTVEGIDLPSGLRLNVTGRFAFDGPRVNFNITRVGAGGLGVGGWPAERLSAAINPLVDISQVLRDVPFTLQVNEARIENGRLRVNARGGLR